MRIKQELINLALNAGTGGGGGPEPQELISHFRITKDNHLVLEAQTFTGGYRVWTYGSGRGTFSVYIDDVLVDTWKVSGLSAHYVTPLKYVQKSAPVIKVITDDEDAYFETGSWSIVPNNGSEFKIAYSELQRGTEPHRYVRYEKIKVGKPTSQITLNENGSFDVGDYGTAVVDVQSAGGGLSTNDIIILREYQTGKYIIVDKNVGKATGGYNGSVELDGTFVVGDAAGTIYAVTAVDGLSCYGSSELNMGDYTIINDELVMQYSELRSFEFQIDATDSSKMTVYWVYTDGTTQRYTDVTVDELHTIMTVRANGTYKTIGSTNGVDVNVSGGDTFTQFITGELKRYVDDTTTTTKYPEVAGGYTYPSWRNVFTKNSTLEYVSLNALSDDVSNYQIDFSYCTSLKEVHLQSLPSLRNSSVFTDCKNLTNIDIPNVTRIDGYSTFANCKSLKVLEMPKVARIAGGSMLNACNNLKLLSINTASTTMSGNGVNAYYFGTTGATDVTLEFANMTELSNFENGNISVKTLVLTNWIPGAERFPTIACDKWKPNVFYVPDELVDAFKAHSNFAPWVDIIKPLSEYVRPVY